MLGAAVSQSWRLGQKRKHINLLMENKNLTVTVQGVINPVPATPESENAGFQSSTSSYRKISTPVAHLAGLEENATGNTSDMAENPFRRNSGIQRSPPLNPRSNTPTSLAVPRSMTPEYVPTGGAFEELGNLIAKLNEFVKTKTNVHHAIKEQIRNIKAAYNKSKDTLASNAKKETAKSLQQETQTSPGLQVETKDLKRSRKSMDSPIKTQTPKRPKKVDNTSNSEKTPVDAPKPVETNDDKDAWKTVKRKKKEKLKGNQKRLVRKNAMVITAKGDATYADILRQIKGEPSLQNLGENVSRIRRTQNGNLLLEINTSKNGIVEEFQEQIVKCIGQQADIRTNKQETRIVCRDIDEITTKSEICAALSNQLGFEEIAEENVKSLRRSYGGTQTAIISLPVNVAYKALKIGKIRIGWVICRLRELVAIKKCYRCLEFGHIAPNCNSPHDRSHTCLRCGTDGHYARDCNNKPECMLCKKEGKSDTLHVAGSGRCPVFKDALTKQRK